MLSFAFFMLVRARLPLKIGTFNIIGTILAVFTLAIGVNGLTLMGLPFFITPVFQGVALILAVGATRYLKQENV